MSPFDPLKAKLRRTSTADVRVALERVQARIAGIKDGSQPSTPDSLRNATRQELRLLLELTRRER